MNKTITAFVMAAALASPLTMASISGAASGKGRTATALSSTSGGTSTSVEYEYERRFVVPAAVGSTLTGRGEVEVELEKKTKTSSTGVITNITKLEAEIEALIPGTAVIDPTTIDANIQVGAVQCTFSALARTAVVPILKNGVAFTKVVIEGSSSVVSPATTATDKGLDCVGDITMLLGSETVTVTNIVGLGSVIANPAPGPLVLDD